MHHLYYLIFLFIENQNFSVTLKVLQLVVLAIILQLCVSAFKIQGSANIFVVTAFIKSAFDFVI